MTGRRDPKARGWRAGRVHRTPSESGGRENLATYAHQMYSTHAQGVAEKPVKCHSSLNSPGRWQGAGAQPAGAALATEPQAPRPVSGEMQPVLGLHPFRQAFLNPLLPSPQKNPLGRQPSSARDATPCPQRDLSMDEKQLVLPATAEAGFIQALPSSL